LGSRTASTSNTTDSLSISDSFKSMGGENSITTGGDYWITADSRLHAGQFIAAAHNVVLIGGPGTGKTHLATAIGIEAVQHLGKR
ncbi:ATP-binding protein, partial [Azoarcus taiwanensis]|uniref:ATP-binding protein n=1 Tax=Azoarcus taiwanensis TaxID=666964 RepID=UPI001B7D1AF6